MRATLLLVVTLAEAANAFSLLTSTSARSICQQSHRLAQADRNSFLEGKEEPAAVVAKDEITVAGLSRRQALFQTATIIGTLLSASASSSAAVPDDCGLEDVLLGKGEWSPLSETAPSPPPSAPPSPPPPTTAAGLAATDTSVPANFATYASRFLLRYDEGAASWWASLVQANSLLPIEKRQSNLGKDFGCLAKSIQIAIQTQLQQQDGYDGLARLLLDRYGQNDKEAQRHIGLLFAMLPSEQQPKDALRQIIQNRRETSPIGEIVVDDNGEDSVDGDASWLEVPAGVESPPPREIFDDLTALLPREYECVKSGGSFTISPQLSLYEVGIDEEFGQTATATAMGPLSNAPLRREQPKFSFSTYSLFGISGATGCAFTHAIVVPLDVVKTRMQTNPGSGTAAAVASEAAISLTSDKSSSTTTTTTTNILESAISIWEKEGPSGLLLGTQATIIGYLWYGLSVYPSYTFFKRFLGSSVLPPEIATVHANDVALVAGALAAVIASIGLTPMEACRIRTVAEPQTYQSKGLLGTMQVIATENKELGWRTLYAGFPSLLTRQVIFGSVKFLAFERTCEAIYKVWPLLHDATWTSLTVSLVAGGLSGCLSSVVSQPADSVLTYIAQSTSSSNNNKGSRSSNLLEGCRQMVQAEGIGSLFRGLGSRCVWAGSIIAGQFLLYDVFRNFFGVTSDDLSQVYQLVIATTQNN